MQESQGKMHAFSGRVRTTELSSRTQPIRSTLQAVQDGRRQAGGSVNARHQQSVSTAKN